MNTSKTRLSYDCPIFNLVACINLNRSSHPVSANYKQDCDTVSSLRRSAAKGRQEKWCAQHTLRKRRRWILACAGMTKKKLCVFRGESLVNRDDFLDLMDFFLEQAFDAIVTGASDKGTWVRLLHPPVEGRLESGFEGMDVGRELRVQLVSTDVERGYIDFKRVV
jgi:hypothetical protein